MLGRSVCEPVNETIRMNSYKQGIYQSLLDVKALKSDLMPVFEAEQT